MSFSDNIKDCFGLDFLCEPSFKGTIFGDTAVYLEGIKTIVKYTPEFIVLSIKNGGVEISGKEMYIKKYCEGDVAICGKIKKIERV